MMNLMILLSIILMISIIIMILSNILSKKLINNREKNSPFECGFDPKSSARTPFSLQFFMIAMIFLIFDIEIALILPIFIILNYSNNFIWFLTSSFFLFILLIGLYYEWKQGMLSWAN
uniref:NADH-ubiquinone oxidoreductase chain 3 n=1 Tax=Homoeoxipha nigripes TaxID=2697520 RepID=A0A6B9VW70_9ORTH|nr:NADH dehydrogenase subunit 3 [Homoeoxipha nigripes]QHQ73127.1 NADH dehydrogenase subunit 3 [Homoeoxipha nigripes]